MNALRRVSTRGSRRASHSTVVTPTPPQRHETEAAFQAAVIDLARHAGWRCYHTHDSRHSEPGFPDLTLVHPRTGRVIFAELKAAGGRLRREQRAWLEALATCPGVETVMWKPADWERLEAALVHGAPVRP